MHDFSCARNVDCGVIFCLNLLYSPNWIIKHTDLGNVNIVSQYLFILSARNLEF